ncbi:MAG: SMP-30/gluconolactonase/LRE family protein, partial [Pseudomonadota bacterium]
RGASGPQWCQGPTPRKGCHPCCTALGRAGMEVSRLQPIVGVHGGLHRCSAKRTIYAFDMDAGGEISNKREFIKLTGNEGAPDGMNVDAEGGLWVSHWGGSRVTRFTPAGDRDYIIEVPVPQVTCCAFGGPDLKTLYITTAWKGMNGEQRQAHPQSGNLFAVDVDIPGLLPTAFKG